VDGRRLAGHTTHNMHYPFGPLTHFPNRNSVLTLVPLEGPSLVQPSLPRSEPSNRHTPPTLPLPVIAVPMYETPESPPNQPPPPAPLTPAAKPFLLVTLPLYCNLLFLYLGDRVNPRRLLVLETRVGNGPRAANCLLLARGDVVSPSHSDNVAVITPEHDSRAANSRLQPTTLGFHCPPQDRQQGGTTCCVARLSRLPLHHPVSDKTAD